MYKSRPRTIVSLVYFCFTITKWLFVLEQYAKFDLLFVLQLEYLRYTDPNPKPFVPSLTLTNKCLINYLKVKKVGGNFFNILRKISKSNRKPTAKTKTRLNIYIYIYIYTNIILAELVLFDAKLI